jgi:hypothetical protein
MLRIPLILRVLMSGTSGVSDSPLMDAEKTDLRRFAGYPVIGSTASGENSWRFFTVYGLFEWRIANLSDTEIVQVRVYLSQLYPLESAIFGASSNLDTDQASVWKHNKKEVSDRIELYKYWRVRLCGFLGVPPGPDIASGSNIII